MDSILFQVLQPAGETEVAVHLAVLLPAQHQKGQRGVALLRFQPDHRFLGSVSVQIQAGKAGGLGSKGGVRGDSLGDPADVQYQAGVGIGKHHVAQQHGPQTGGGLCADRSGGVAALGLLPGKVPLIPQGRVQLVGLLGGD